MSGTTLQWLIVAIIVVAAAVYTWRAFVRQFYRSEDEPTACDHCAAKQLVEQARQRDAGPRR